MLTTSRLLVFLLAGLVCPPAAMAACGECQAPAPSTMPAPLPHGGYWARVLSVSPVRLRYEEPVLVSDCHLGRATRGTAGMVAGGLAGGLLGSTVGGGLGRSAAIVGGVATGAVLGKSFSRRDAQVACSWREVLRTTRTSLAYDVVYRSGLTGAEGVVRLDREPEAWVWVDVSRADPFSPSP